MSAIMSRTPASVNIEKRVIAHGFSTSIPRFWANNNPVVTAFFHALSSVIPTGEKFFIRTVEETAKTIENPGLKAEIQGFIDQESQHRVGHAAMNEWIREQGYAITAVERGVNRLLGWVEQYCSLKYQLALTVALEHFSCLLSDQFLRHKALQSGLHPVMREFLVAHCIEEIEHKAVAFDVYQEVYGDFFARILMMLFVTLVFAPNVFRIQFIYLWHERHLFNFRAWGGAIRYFWFSPGWFGGTIPGYLAYFKPRFHPWQHDNTGLIDHYLKQSGQQA